MKESLPQNPHYTSVTSPWLDLCPMVIQGKLGIVSTRQEKGFLYLILANPALNCGAEHNNPGQNSISQKDRDFILGQEMNNIPHISNTRKECLWPSRSRSNRTEVISLCFVCFCFNSCWHFILNLLQPSFSKCGPQISSLSVIWELVRKADS